MPQPLAPVVSPGASAAADALAAPAPANPWGQQQQQQQPQAQPPSMNPWEQQQPQPTIRSPPQLNQLQGAQAYHSPQQPSQQAQPAPARVTLSGRVGAWQDLMGTYSLIQGRTNNTKPMYMCTTFEGVSNFIYCARDGSWNVTDDEEDIGMDPSSIKVQAYPSVRTSSYFLLHP